MNLQFYEVVEKVVIYVQIRVARGQMVGEVVGFQNVFIYIESELEDNWRCINYFVRVQEVVFYIKEDFQG